MSERFDTGAMDLAAALELATDLRPRSRLLADLPLAFTTVPDKNAGDVYTEAMWDTYTRDNFNSGVWRAIADSTVSGSPVSTIDFSSIPATFAHLALILYGRGDAAGNAISCSVRFNNDSGANYDWVATSMVVGSAVTPAESLATTSARLGRLVGAAGPANGFSAMYAWIPHYTNATNHKTMRSVSSTRERTGGSNCATEDAGSAWFAAAAAINRITILPSSGNFVVGTRATLIGIPN